MTSASLFSDKSRDESEFAEQCWFSKFLNLILLLGSFGRKYLYPSYTVLPSKKNILILLSQKLSKLKFSIIRMRKEGTPLVSDSEWHKMWA